MMTRLTTGSSWIYYDTNANVLLAALGKLFRLNNCEVAVDHDELLGFIILMAYVLNESDEFIDFVSSHKLVEASSDLNIYWTLRYNKLKKLRLSMAPVLRKHSLCICLVNNSHLWASLRRSIQKQNTTTFPSVVY